MEDMPMFNQDNTKPEDEEDEESEYWAKRKANMIYQQMTSSKQADKFDKVYQLRYLDKEINRIFDKFQR